MSDPAPEEINRVLSEWMGWSRFGMFGPYGKCAIISLGVSLHGTPPEDKDKPEDDQAYLPVPNFATDLNAIATIEAKLTDEQLYNYAKTLVFLQKKGDNRVFCSTPLRRAHGLVRSLGLVWID